MVNGSAGARRTIEHTRFEIILNLSGGAANYAIYALYIRTHASTTTAPAIGLALGSLAGMLVSFHLSRRLVFNGRVGSDVTELR